MKNVVEIDDALYIPPPFAAVFDSIKTVSGEMQGNAFVTPCQNKPLIQQMVDAKILPAIWNPADAYIPRGEYTPYAHQRDMMRVYVASKAAYNYAAMGAMKTSATLWAFDTLRMAGRVDRLLVIAPVSVMTSAWVNDSKKATPHLRCGVLFGSKAKRTKKINDDLDDVLVINHDGTKVVSDALLDWIKRHKVMVVCDEATAIARYNTARSKVITQIGKVAARRYVLTATPVAQSLLNAHGYLTFINNCQYPKTLTAFRQEYFVNNGMHKWIAKVSSFEKLQALMAPAIRINTRDVVDLPPNVILHRWPAMTSDQQHAYSVMEDTLVYEHDPTTIITAANAAVKLSKLLQVTCGILIGEGDKVVSLPPTGKMEELLTIIEEAQSKVMICVPFTAALDYIVKFLGDKFSPEAVAFINGSVSASKRPEIVDRFQDPDDPLTFLVVHPKAAGHGLTLTEADTTVWFSPTTSAESFIQANKRIDRPGQTRHTRTILMSSTELEKKMYESLLTKGDDNDTFVEIYNSVIARKLKG